MLIFFNLFLLFSSFELKKIYLNLKNKNKLNERVAINFGIIFFGLIFSSVSFVSYVLYVGFSFYFESGFIIIFPGIFFIILVFYLSLYRRYFFLLESTALAYADGIISEGVIINKTPLFYGPLRLSFEYDIDGQKYRGYFITGPWLFYYNKWEIGQEIDVISAKNSPKHSQIFEREKLNNMCLDKSRIY